MRPDMIVIHCSASEFGSPILIDNWHRARGFMRGQDQIRPLELKHVGYHRIITNGRLNASSTYDLAEDGRVYLGRRDDEVGAHAKGSNATSLGVCMIGEGTYTPRQVNALILTVTELVTRFGIPSANVIGHNETPFEIKHKTKGCPLFDVSKLRSIVWELRKNFEHAVGAPK